MKEYDLVIIGGGSAGITAAEFAAKLGVRTAVIEKNRIGGDCTWTGCIPSKTLIETANLVHNFRGAELFGLQVEQPTVSFSNVLKRINQVVEDIYQEESPDVLEELGVEVYHGEARFLDANTLSLDEIEINSKYFLLSTGAHAWIPPILGLEKVEYLTYEDVWSLKELPERILILGGGAVGVEFSQAFQRLGSQVTLLDAGERLIKAADPQASRALKNILEAEGVRVHSQTLADRAWQDSEGIHLQAGGKKYTAEQLLLSVGRRPNVQGLDLEKAGVEYDLGGIKVDRNMQTSVPNIYAAGDCTGGPQFTHVASWQAFNAVRNALLPGDAESVIEHPPWTLFTDPEIAQVGLTSDQARERFGEDVKIRSWPMLKVDRAHTAGAKEGFVQVIYRESGQVLGATVVGKRAGELIHEWVLAVTHDLKVGDIAYALHSYPSYAMANMQTATEIQTAKNLPGFQDEAMKTLSREG